MGYAKNRKNANRAFLFNGGALIDITGKDASHGNAISNQGVVVGVIPIPDARRGKAEQPLATAPTRAAV